MVIDLSFSLIFRFGEAPYGILLENVEFVALDSGMIADIPERVQCEYLALDLKIVL